MKRTLGIEATADGKSNCEILWCGYLDKQFGPIFGDTTFEDFSRDTDFVPTTKNLHLQTDIIGWKVWLKGYKQGRQGKTGIVGGSKAKLYVVESFDSKSNCHMLTNPKDDYDRKYMYMGPLPITEEQQKMIKNSQHNIKTVADFSWRLEDIKRDELINEDVGDDGDSDYDPEEEEEGYDSDLDSNVSNECDTCHHDDDSFSLERPKVQIKSVTLGAYDTIVHE